MFDLLIRGGHVIDGTRAPRYPADVGVTGDRITAIGDLRDAQAKRVVDAAHKVVAPGFIDVHNHTDGWMLRRPHLEAKTRQGFTTELLMSDGISYAPVDAVTAPEWFFYLRALDALRLDEYTGWESLADYQKLLDRRNVQNNLVQIPYANVRTLACGFGSRPVDDLQNKLIQAEIRRGMEQGATGLSTGLDYIAQCFATTDELVDAASAMKDFGGIYVTHIRYKRGLIEGVREAVEIGRRAGVAVHISHLKPHNPQEVEPLLTYIDKHARHEVDFSFEVYPYQPGSTMLNYLLPYEVWEDGPLAVLGKLTRPEIRARFRRALDVYRLPLNRISIAWVASAENKIHQGKFLSEYVASTRLAPEEALLRLLIEERLAVLLVFHDGDDDVMKPMLQHDLGMIGSDGIYFDDAAIHPRVWGTAPRMLGRAVREWRLFSLEDAVHKLAFRAAQRFGITDRGEIAKGRFADLVVFDPKTVDDTATFATPQQAPKGIETVIVNGVPIIAGGDVVPLTEYPGRSLSMQRR